MPMLHTEILQQKIEHWCAATIRALTNEPSVSYKGHRLYVNEKPFPIGVPHLHLDSYTNDYRILRGIADGIALRFCHSDRKLHQRLLPEHHLQRWIFELLEQLRTESLAPSQLPGIRTNLQRRFIHWITQINGSGLTENHSAILVFSLVVICWSRLTGAPPPEPIADIIEATRLGLSRVIGGDLVGLKKHREDQHAYAQHALSISRLVQGMLDDARFDNSDDENKELDNFIKTSSVGLSLLAADNTALDESGGIAIASNTTVDEQRLDYRVFTRAYDKVRDITQMARAEQLINMRASLDKRWQQQHVNIARLAQYFSQLFASPQLAGWDFQQEEGHLDASRLVRLVTSLDERKVFRLEAAKPKVDCVVSILIDNSGSMKQHSNDIALIVETLLRALDMAGAQTEVLGFTTNKWNGGAPYKEWLASSRPENPGRMNELCHIVYKAAEVSWRRSRQGIAGLLKPDIYKESLDGEALQWADERIKICPQSRRIIMVISDGSPMDTATQQTNTDDYLDNHLKQVATAIEQRDDVHLCALGLGLDLSTYYSRSQIILNRELDTKAFFDIADLLANAK